jgi:hypothetical protein
MDANECTTLISAARDIQGKTPLEICEALDRAGQAFQSSARQKHGRKGEW